MTRLRIFLAFALSFVLTVCASNTVMAYTPQSLPPPTKNVYEIIAANKKLEKFLKMIDQAGLKELFSPASGEPITVFAPSNDAIANIPSDELKRIEASPANLQSFVKYHAIAGSMVSSGAIKGRRSSPASANGEALSFDGSDRTKAPKIGDGELVEGDIAATNGVVHIVSSALVPPSLQAAPAPPAAQPPPTPQAVRTPPEAAPTAAAPEAAPASPAAATTSASPPAPEAVKVTTSGVAKVPAMTVPKGSLAPGSDGVAVTATGVAKAPPSSQPAGLPDTTSSSGFELFGHKFSW